MIISSTFRTFEDVITCFKGFVTEFTGLVGPSGSGKTTLLNIIGSLDIPTEGSVHVLGNSIAALSHRESAMLRNRHIGFIFQTYNLLPVYTVFENVEFTLLLQKMPAGQRKKAVMDALYGCPPNIFPFGSQYAWVGEMLKETYTYKVKLEDDTTQQAIKSALPVAKLHKKTGMHEMVSFDFVTDDLAVQTTTFSNGTRIVANISDNDKETEEYGLIKANSWKEL